MTAGPMFLSVGIIIIFLSCWRVLSAFSWRVLSSLGLGLFVSYCYLHAFLLGLFQSM